MCFVNVAVVRIHHFFSFLYGMKLILRFREENWAQNGVTRNMISCSKVTLIIEIMYFWED